MVLSVCVWQMENNADVCDIWKCYQSAIVLLASWLMTDTAWHTHTFWCLNILCVRISQDRGQISWRRGKTVVGGGGAGGHVMEHCAFQKGGKKLQAKTTRPHLSLPCNLSWLFSRSVRQTGLFGFLENCWALLKVQQQKDCKGSVM